jgi:hypothetical protein
MCITINTVLDILLAVRIEYLSLAPNINHSANFLLDIKRRSFVRGSYGVGYNLQNVSGVVEHMSLFVYWLEGCNEIDLLARFGLLHDFCGHCQHSLSWICCVAYHLPGRSDSIALETRILASVDPIGVPFVRLVSCTVPRVSGDSDILMI